MKNGLVLEGGGSRGVYTAGVLEELYKLDIKFDYIIGTSMGVCNATSFISNQPKRNKKVIVDYLDDSRYFNFSNILKKNKSVFGMDFLFDEIPNNLEPFNYKNFFNSSIELKMTATNINLGKCEYFSNKNIISKEKLMKTIRATCSLPIFTVPIEINKNLYMDGGITDSIPIKKAISDNIDNILVILTRDITYRKKPVFGKFIYKLMYNEYPNLIKAMDKRYINYNKTLDYIKKLEKSNKIIVLRPSRPINISKLEKNKKKFNEIFLLGKKDLHNKKDNIIRYFK